VSESGRASPAPSLILGTAGHIDHGKTALIGALTGVDTDRLPEEKQRGITIELGFAPLDLAPDLRLGVVDVPGHEGLVRTMVAGATGIDLVLLVVAADEGVMPQTREHLAICSLLGLTHGVVALTKVDLIDPELAQLAAEEVGLLLEDTALAGAAVVPVSARTGEGIEALRATLLAAARDCGARTPRRGPARLWVDRSFEMRGFGTVVTGTLTGAPLRTGQALEILPEGRAARIRGLQRFGKTVAEAPPGARCAVNLQGVTRAQVSRGDLLCTPEALTTTDSFDAELQWLATAPATGRRPFAVELLVGTRAARARIAAIGAEGFVPGTRALARVHLDAGRLPLLPGDRFILRGFAPTAEGGNTVGGGRVLDVAPARRRRSDPALRRSLTRLGADPSEAIGVRILRSGFGGISQDDLRRQTGLAGEALKRAIATSREPLTQVGDRWISAAALATLAEQALVALGAFHDREPLRPGMPRETLRGALPANVPAAAFEAVLADLQAAGRIEREAGRVRAADFVPRLTQRQEVLAARLRADAAIAGLEPPTLRGWQQELGVAEAELRDLLAHLEREGSLIRAPGDLWFDRGAVDELRAQVVAHLAAHGSLATPAYKELIGTTRKYAVPLMELFDEERLTLRRGEARVLRPGGRA